MIKLASFTIVPALAATFFSNQEPLPPPPTVDLRPGIVDQDRQFLDALNHGEIPVRNTDHVDLEFLTSLQEDDRLAAAAGREKIPVMRAIPIERPVPVSRATVPAPTQASSSESQAPEIRRAVAVTPTAITNLRNTLQRPYVTMIEPEARQATAANQRRASITIYGDEVIIRPKAASSQAVALNR